MPNLSFADKLKKRNNRIRVQKLTNLPPLISNDKIVFYSSNDFSDNALALYEYMVQEKMDKRYEIVWLVRDVKRCMEKNTGNARFVYVKDDKLKMWTWQAQQEAMSAKWLFFTHSMDWVKIKRPEQTFVNLWHGCGYKGEKVHEDDGGRQRRYFDICTVTGPKYVDVQAALFKSNMAKIIPTGYARTDWFVTKKHQSKEYVESLKLKTGTNKIIIWMPTFRQSWLDRVDDTTKCSESGLPLIKEQEDLEWINEFCSERGILIILKSHNLQKAYNLKDLSNLMLIGDKELDEKNVNLYGLIANTDGLISDYSSVAIDYMLLDKPIGYILDDFEEYERVRGWDLDDVKAYMPGDHIYTLNDMQMFIKAVSNGEDHHRDWRIRVNTEVNIDSDSHCFNIINYLKL